MALEDGAPSIAAPELFRQLTPWERRFADRAPARRLQYRGLGDPEFRDDQQPAEVAAECIRRAATRAATFGVFLVLAAFFTVVLVNQVHEIPKLVGRTVVIGCLAAVVLIVLTRVVRGVQVRRFLADQPPAPPRPAEPWVDREPERPLGPDDLAPVLMRRLTRPERALVRSVFPGEGQISTGKPHWNGGPADRVILRRALRFDTWFVALMAWFCGSLLVDVGLSGLAGLFDKGPADGISGAFVVGWMAGLVWFVRRRLQIRRWYRAGVGHEAELARQVAGRPPDPAARPAGPSASRSEPSGRAKILLTLATDALLIGMAVFLAQGGLDARAESRPVDGGVTTTGTVVKVERFEGSRGGDTYRTRVRFSDQAGRTFTIRGTQGEERAREGQTVQVSYDPSHPEDGHDITTNTSAWKWPFFSGLFPAVIALVSLIILGVMVARGSLRWREEPQD